jgi:hypothetical protein
MATVPPPPGPIAAAEVIELDEGDLEVVKPPKIPGRY